MFTKSLTMDDEESLFVDIICLLECYIDRSVDKIKTFEAQEVYEIRGFWYWKCLTSFIVPLSNLEYSYYYALFIYIHSFSGILEK